MFVRFIPIECTAVMHSFSLLCDFLSLTPAQYLNCPRAGGDGHGSSWVFINSAAEPSPSFPWHACQEVSQNTYRKGVGFEVVPSSSS